MDAYANARLFAVERNSFKDKEGQEVVYFVNYVKDTEGRSMQEMNSKADFSAVEGKVGIARIRIRNVDNGIKLSLAGFIPDETFEIPEEDIS